MWCTFQVDPTVTLRFPVPEISARKSYFKSWSDSALKTMYSFGRVVGLESWTWTQVGLESDFLRTWTGLGLEGQGLGLGLGLER